MADIFVARQPILGKDKQVYAYELLFRGAADQFGYQALDGERATAQVLENSLLNIGLAKLTNQRPAFVNFPAAVLLSGFTENGRALLLGTDIGGLGTPAASLASLISLRLYAMTDGAESGKYLLVFSVINFAMLAALLAFAAAALV